MKNDKKIILILILIIFFTFNFRKLLAKPLNFITNPPGLSNYSISVTQGQLLNKKTNLQFIVQPTQGPRVIPNLLESKDGDIATLSCFVTYNAYIGRGEFKKPLKFLRVLQSSDLNYFGIITREDTGIRTIPELKGKRISYMITSLVGKTIMELSLQAYGLTSGRDVTVIKAEDVAFAFRDLAQRRTDAVSTLLAGPALRELATKTKLTVLPIEVEKVFFMQKELPALFPGTTSKYLPGINPGVPVVGSPILLIGCDDLNEDIAYTIVKTLIENYDELIKANPLLADWRPEVAVRELPIPYHQGAIKYYKEKGLWSHKMDQLQLKLLNK